MYVIAIWKLQPPPPMECRWMNAYTCIQVSVCCARVCVQRSHVRSVVGVHVYLYELNMRRRNSSCMRDWESVTIFLWWISWMNSISVPHGRLQGYLYNIKMSMYHNACLAYAYVWCVLCDVCMRENEYHQIWFVNCFKFIIFVRYNE